MEREHLNSPQQQRQIAYWRLCLHALTGKQAEALHIFREALDQGYWYASRSVLFYGRALLVFLELSASTSQFAVGSNQNI